MSESENEMTETKMVLIDINVKTFGLDKDNCNTAYTPVYDKTLKNDSEAQRHSIIQVW